MVFLGEATKQTRETLTYTNTLRGALVSYNHCDMEAGGRGTHIWDIPSVASAEAAQRLLQPPHAAGAARRSSSGPGAALGHPRAALGRPTPKPRAATAKPCPLRGDGRRWKETHRAPDFNSNFFTNLSKERQSQWHASFVYFSFCFVTRTIPSHNLLILQPDALSSPFTSDAG